VDRLPRVANRLQFGREVDVAVREHVDARLIVDLRVRQGAEEPQKLVGVQRIRRRLHLVLQPRLEQHEEQEQPEDDEGDDGGDEEDHSCPLSLYSGRGLG
jgi:hypothetical protein